MAQKNGTQEIIKTYSSKHLSGVRLNIKDDVLITAPIKKLRELLGRILEDSIHTALIFQPKHVRQVVRNFINGLGADFAVKLDEGEVTLEAKNYNGKYNVTPFHVLYEIIPRFNVVDPQHETMWILVISKLKASKKVRKMLEEAGILIVEVGYQLLPTISNQDMQKAIRLIAKKLNRVFTKLKQQTVGVGEVVVSEGVVTLHLASTQASVMSLNAPLHLKKRESLAPYFSRTVDRISLRSERMKNKGKSIVERALKRIEHGGK